MSEPPPPIQPWHYQVLCGLALGMIFLVLVPQGLLLVALAVLLLGTASVLLKARLSPVLLVIMLVGGLLYEQYVLPRWRPHTVLEADDVLLCAATLAYVAGHYRLLSIWTHILPPDPRQRVPKELRTVLPPRKIGRVVLQARSAALLSHGELPWLLLQVPLFALAAQGAWMALGARRQLHDVPLRLVQLMQVAWCLALVLFLAGQFFRYWRWRTMERMTARVLLQDVLWHETRGEQRRIARWLAWWRLSRLRVSGSASTPANPQAGTGGD